MGIRVGVAFRGLQAMHASLEGALGSLQNPSEIHFHTLFRCRAERLKVKFSYFSPAKLEFCNFPREAQKTGGPPGKIDRSKISYNFHVFFRFGKITHLWMRWWYLSYLSSESLAPQGWSGIENS